MEPRITLVTLGVRDLNTSFHFYKDTIGFPSKEGIQGDVVFFQLNHMMFSLYPKNMLAKDAGVSDVGSGFGGITLAHNLKTKEEVDALAKTLTAKGVKIIKQPQKTNWGGYHLWEVAWNPFF